MYSLTHWQYRLPSLLLLPVVNVLPLQVELNPSWQQKKLIEFCRDKGIHVTAYSPLGGQTGPSSVLQSGVLEEIAKARGKSVAQVLVIAVSKCLNLVSIYLSHVF
jgi:diketogulonate reductase-like aldo/keto reductase